MCSSHINTNTKTNDLLNLKVQYGEKVSVYPHLLMHMQLAVLPTTNKKNANGILQILLGYTHVCL
jgi:hypothetical protein